MTLEKIIRNTTLWVYSTWKDKDGTGIAGISDHTLTVTDPTGTDKTPTPAPTVTEDGNGVYHFSILVPSDAVAGEWKVRWRIVTAGGDVGTDDCFFEVQE